MTDNNTSFPCPFCGHEMPHTAEGNVGHLRALMMSQIVPALVHDVGHSVDSLRMNRHLIERDLASKASERLKDFLDRDEKALDRVSDFLRTLRELYRGEQDDAAVPLAQLPDRLAWFCELCEFPAPVDFGPLKQSQSRVSYRVYWDAFRFAVQGALLAIRRDRAPNARIEFSVLERELTTSLVITRKSLPEPRPMEWRALEWLIRSAGGTVRIETDGETTVLRWSVHLK